MITYSNGTVFNQKVDAIVNTVNCIGVMGAGLALEFGLRYPNIYKQYKIDCEEKLYNPGTVKFYNSDNGYIINFATKWHFKYPSQEAWIKTGLVNFIKIYKNYNIKSVAFPKLGTNNGGLDWSKIKVLMNRYLDPLDDLDVIICLDNNNYAEGDELLMLNLIKNNTEYVLEQIGKLTKPQINTLLNSIPNINRFWQISKLDGIGTTTYSKIFNYCYENMKSTHYEQLSIFD